MQPRNIKGLESPMDQTKLNQEGFNRKMSQS